MLNKVGTFRLGLTGDMGSGKSTVLNLFAEMGYATLSTDRVVHDLMDKDSEVIGEITSKFGDNCLTEKGDIDRRRLGEIVFKSGEDRKWLEELIHPRVRKEWKAWLIDQSSQLSMVEIPLLFEKKLESEFDSVISVWCSVSVKRERLKARHLSQEAIEARSRVQMEQSLKAERSNFLILNNGSLEFLRNQVDNCVKQLVS